MLSHLRFHRRGAGSSTPSSPAEAGAGVASDNHQIHDHQIHDQADHQPTSPLSATTHQPQPSPSQFAFPSPGDGQTPSSAFSSLPPTLPPIARVASPEPPDDVPRPEPVPELASCDPPQQQQRYADDMSPPTDSRSAHQAQRSPYNNMDSGFIGGVALRNYKRDLQAQVSSRRDNADASTTLGTQNHSSARQRPVPAPINTSTPPARPPPQVLPQPYSYKSGSSSFVAPTELQNASSNPTGRRPAGTRLTTDPSTLPSSSNHLEPQKAKKGLPFLKNPMSTLLMRRRNGQTAPDLLPPPIAIETDEPTYDPRIRGTRVHDFSAPRRQGHPTGSEPPLRSSGQDHASQEERRPGGPPQPRGGSAPVHGKELGVGPSEVTLIESYGAFAPSTGTNAGSALSHNAYQSTSPGRAFSQGGHSALQKDGSRSSVKSQQTSSSRYSDASTAAPSREGTSKRMASSRKISLSSDMSTMSRPSRLPKHMKSTSSRFSFDMIGVAEEERILEERHRQREAEKKVTEEFIPRDSRFDDFDEDAFDYDAMMDDDGLEERIPGVNADYDEEDDYYLEENLDDPDNDQDNFAGFAFQRSNGNSPLPTSHSGATGTPQDADDRFLALPPQASPHLQDSPIPPGPEQVQSQQAPGALPAGLGIQGAGIQGSGEPAVDARKKPMYDEDLYFDDGMAAEFAEDLERSPSIDGTPFDESIFDNNDTDQYGRPIAGAFAHAQSERQAAQGGSIKRESDMTSRFSAQSEVTRSTAHTSVSVAALPQQRNEATADSQKGLDPAPSSFVAEQGSMAAYQAALAAAAHKAAASGKFQWSSSGAPDEDVDEPTADGQLFGKLNYDEGDDQYDFKYENMDDFELDDDAIIAEANASALANDLDGWYGQEFGFYSAPVNHSHGSRDSGSSAGDGYQFANGGFFGPKGADGVNRTKSGRVVSREPNLTPITERSEYSNRNSVMSMAMPPHGFGTPVQSPGLAQLAMMVDQSDEMSLSALLRLRSKAWGGSQASQASSKEGSPKSDRGDNPQLPWTASWGGHANGNSIHGRKGSLVSGASYESDAGSAAGSPTITMSMSTSAPVGSDHGIAMVGANLARLSASSQPEKLQTGNLPNTDYGGDYGSNPTSANPMTSQAERRRSQEGISPAVSHRRSGSAHQHRNSADSISYTREEESGEMRWVIERRRIDDSGQVEMEREVVEGGRI